MPSFTVDELRNAMDKPEQIRYALLCRSDIWALLDSDSNIVGCARKRSVFEAEQMLDDILSNIVKLNQS